MQHPRRITAFALTAAFAAVFLPGPARAQTIDAYYAGSSIAAGQTAWINPCEAITGGNTGTDCPWPAYATNFPDPDLSFQLAAPYDTAAYAVNWSVEVVWTDRAGHGQNTIVQTTARVSGAVRWKVPWSGYVGGSAKVTAQVFSQCRPAAMVGAPMLSLFIWGANQSAAQIQQELAVLGGPWFTGQVLRLESSGYQFSYPDEDGETSAPIGRPLWGPPDGIGVMQVDRTAQPSYFAGSYAPYWDFITNAGDGVEVETSYAEPTGAAHWTKQLTVMCNAQGGTWEPSTNNCSNGKAVKLAGPACPNGPGGVAATFAFIPGAAQQPPATISYATALSIQAYNGYDCNHKDRDFVTWVNNKGWRITYPADCAGLGKDYDYVGAVCRAQPY